MSTGINPPAIVQPFGDLFSLGPPSLKRTRWQRDGTVERFRVGDRGELLPDLPGHELPTIDAGTVADWDAEIAAKRASVSLPVIQSEVGLPVAPAGTEYVWRCPLCCRRDDEGRVTDYGPEFRTPDGLLHHLGGPIHRLADAALVERARRRATLADAVLVPLVK